MNLKVILGKRKMKVKSGATGRYLRFCELCGSFVGNLTGKEWESEGCICRTCAQAYGSSVEIQVNNLDDRNYSWELSRERTRISRLY
jgi:hypothetical protein